MSHHQMDHSHHHSHHHGMDNDSTTTTTLLPDTSTAATAILNAVVTTLAAHGADHHLAHGGDHHGPTDHVTSQVSARHVTAGDHMQMYFQFGVDATILFKEWATSSTQGIIFSMIAIFILAAMYEGIKFFREFLFKKYFTSLEYSSVSVLGDDGKPVTEVHKVARNRMCSWPHMIQTFLHVVQMVISYFLMLIFMTYNVWLCLAVVAGAGFGYFLFGWRKATVVDITEHCH